MVAIWRKNWPMVHENHGCWLRNAGGRYSQCSFCVKSSVREKVVIGSRWSLKLDFSVVLAQTSLRRQLFKVLNVLKKWNPHCILIYFCQNFCTEYVFAFADESSAVVVVFVLSLSLWEFFKG